MSGEMDTIAFEITVAALTGIFAVLLLLYLRMMVIDMSSFTWKNYFQTCDIYNNRSHWTRIIKFIRTYLQTIHSNEKGKEKLLKQ